MNIHQPDFHNPENTWIHKESQDFSGSIIYFKKKLLELYKYTDNDGSTILTLVNSESNQVEYGFHNSKIDWKVEHINKFKLWTMRSKWHSQKKWNYFIPQTASSKNLNTIKNFINKYESKQYSNCSEKIIKNPDFPDGTYFYKNQYWKEFKVLILGGKAINITCDNNYITGHQKWAIQRAINENRLDKFEEFVPNVSTELQVIENTTNQVESIINPPLEWELMPRISDNLEIIYMNFETLQKNSHNDIHTSKILLPALSILKLLITDFEISSDDLEYMLSTRELTETLFTNISKKLQPQLKYDDNKKISVILEKLQLIFTARLSRTKDNSNQYTQNTNQRPEDFDFWDDLCTRWFEEENIEDISAKAAWNTAMNWHRNNQEAKEYRARH